MMNKLVANAEKQHRALKLRIYPNPEQTILINKTFGCCRQIYNNRLFERNEFYQNVIKNESDKNKQKELWKKAHFSTEKEMKAKFPYMTEVSAQALCSATMFAEIAYKNFFSSIKGNRAGAKVGKPKFKSKKSNDFSYRECNPSEKALNWNERKVKVPKLGEVKFRHSGNKKGKLDFFLRGEVELKSITIRKNPANEYYAVLLSEREYCHKKKIYEGDESQAIGLDFSPADFYIDSDGSSGKDFGYVAQKQANLKKLTKLQRRLMRKQISSNNREKARVKVARMEHYIAECRNDWIEKETKRLVSSYQVIGIEDLNLKGMMKFSRNAKNYGDASWGNFTNKLLWKASLNENNCQIVKADRFFASSQICHCCGFKNPITKNLNIRSWTCPECGAEHIRDVNAAINLKMNAIKNVGQGVSEFRSVEGVEDLATLALQIGASEEAENLTGDGQNVLTL
ncbi:RNA-guided endonuclease TnpB family protein [Treponema saccharophilum]|uniref:Transposase IS891/IS1136/IS1341 family n=1 Tax=Treponema saccharophilum DSM 2985 TaxID=907348 RepID=H7EML3_9SPIR|nr:RNA-guided endonuclease TnpB family protein [Treponema saccharophilum]EIC01298.1 transposase IS891/IS1136/IS1341 family [Treponema saccharophilum DSM 2985]BDC96052.1 transposase [Treponema saccharophilum]